MRAVAKKIVSLRMIVFACKMPGVEQPCGDEKMSLQVKRNINASKTIEDTKTFKLYLHIPAFL